MPRRTAPARRPGGTARRPAVPAQVRAGLVERLERHAHERWGERCRAVTVRFRGAFAYVDAISATTWNLRDEPLSVDEAATETHLCRLGYIGSPDLWAFAFYKYSDERYEPSVLPSGDFAGSPEQAFDCAASVYLAA